jgi:hypothetical protein
MAMDGKYRLDGVAVGRHQLRAFRPGGPGGGGREPNYGPEVEVEVKAGETTTFDLQLPAQ